LMRKSLLLSETLQLLIEFLLRQDQVVQLQVELVALLSVLRCSEACFSRPLDTAD
jgi:hypothetical protein